MENKNKEIFALQADKYFKDDYWRYDEEYLANRYFKLGGSILVLGCGGGRTLSYLHKKGLKITAIDIVPEMVEKAKEKTRGMDVSVLEMDATDLKFKDSSFDYVFFPFHGIDCIYPDIYKCVKEAARVLRPEGIFIFNSHNRLSLKALCQFFDGKYSDYGGLILYRAGISDLFRLKKYFKKVQFKYRISMQPLKKSNWKDVIYKIFPIFDRSVYFICLSPKNKITEREVDWDKYLSSRVSKAWFPMEKYEKYIKGNILDIGCGHGEMLSGFAGRGELYGIDPAENTICQAQGKVPQAHFMVGDALCLPFKDNFFNFVYSCDVIEHVKDYEGMVKEAARVLKTGGVLVMKTPNYPVKRLYDLYHTIKGEQSFMDDPTHVSKLSAFQLKGVLKKYFKEVEVEVRNIMFEDKLPFLKRFKNSFFGYLLGQKIITFCKK
jgi:ubiquinone/menaquinone biosynthesis C-methylase UbiE